MDGNLFINLPRVLLPKTSDQLMMSEDDWQVKACGFNIFVPAGTKMDGASIPRFLWRVCGHPMQHPRVYAALAHDFLYSGIGWYYDVSRKEADRVYCNLLVRLGFGRMRAFVEYVAIRLFGWRHWQTKMPSGISYINENRYVVRI